MIYALDANSNRQGSDVDGGAMRPLGGATTEGDGCAFILEGSGRCGAARQRGSSYCAPHHALCHIPGGSRRERRRLGEAEALAAAIGGKAGRAATRPSERFLRRLERAARGFLRPGRSRIVREDDAP